MVKLQTATLAAKLLVLVPADRTLALLTRYVLSLARYDQNVDVRDRVRMLGSLLTGVSAALHSAGTGGEEYEEEQDVGGVVLRREQVKMVLFEGKLGVVEDKQGGVSQLSPYFLLIYSKELTLLSR